MNQDEYRAHLAEAPATPNQVGAIHRQAARLGLTDRAARLAVCAELLGLGSLGSTRDLSQGDAGRLVGILSRARGRADLPGAARDAGEDQGDEGAAPAEQDDGPRGMSIAEALCRFALLVLAELQREAGGP